MCRIVILGLDKIDLSLLSSSSLPRGKAPPASEGRPALTEPTYPDREDLLSFRTAQPALTVIPASIAG